MSFYSDNIFPLILDHTEPKEMATLRKSNLADVQDDILEIGIGTGSNLAYYPERINHLTSIEPLRAMQSIAMKKGERNSILINWHIGVAEDLPFEKDSFNTVVTTGLLCSVEEPAQVLKEIYRVLKPLGKYYFLEHGLSRIARIRRYQKLLNGVNKSIACGCNLTRDIENLIENSSFENSEYFYPKPFKGIGSLYEPIQGIATK